MAETPFNPGRHGGWQLDKTCFQQRHTPGTLAVEYGMFLTRTLRVPCLDLTRTLGPSADVSNAFRPLLPSEYIPITELYRLVASIVHSSIKRASVASEDVEDHHVGFTSDPLSNQLRSACCGPILT